MNMAAIYAFFLVRIFSFSSLFLEKSSSQSLVSIPIVVQRWYSAQNRLLNIPK